MDDRELEALFLDLGSDRVERKSAMVNDKTKFVRLSVHLLMISQIVRKQESY